MNRANVIIRVEIFASTDLFKSSMITRAIKNTTIVRNNLKAMILSKYFFVFDLSLDISLRANVRKPMSVSRDNKLANANAKEYIPRPMSPKCLPIDTTIKKERTEPMSSEPNKKVVFLTIKLVDDIVIKNNNFFKYIAIF